MVKYINWLRYVKRCLNDPSLTLMDVEAMYDWKFLYNKNLSASMAVSVYNGSEYFDENQIAYGFPEILY